ncbi:MAG TPA: hypothetical protein VK172_00940 [Lentimicrobium sp.]|nr:hypothetical protein [Lentimicrobium sp.]
MKNLALLTLLVALSIGASGQSKEISVSLSHYKMEISQYYLYQGGSKELSVFEEVNNLCNIGLGYYFPVYTPQPNLGIGINASLNGGLRYHTTSFHEIFGDAGLPVTASFRYGAGSTREATSPVGVGIGAGYRLNAMILPSGDPFYIQEDPVAIVLFRPYLYAEFVLDYLRRDKSFFDNFKIQFAYQPSLTRTAASNGTAEDITSKMSYFSISFIKFSTLD